MSGQDRISKNDAVLLEKVIRPSSLESDLGRIGVPALADAFAEKMRANAVYGLPPHASSWRLRLQNYLFKKPQVWRIFTFDEYFALENARYGRVIQEYGTPMPSEIARRVGLVRTHLPDARIEVHALWSDDPLVKVIRGSQTKWIGAWYGQGRLQRVFLGV